MTLISKWPESVATALAMVRLTLAMGHAANPRILRGLDPMISGTIDPTDDELLDLLAAFAITAPPLREILPEAENTEHYRAALQAVRSLIQASPALARHNVPKESAD